MAKSRFLGLRPVDVLTLTLACALFLALTLYQITLPGLYYDEAWDAVSAMQIVQGLPTELQRGAGIDLLGRHWPLMLGDYQGIISTYLLVPFFLIGGSNVLSLRLFPILAGVVAILLTYVLGRLWFSPGVGRLAALLLAVSPSWIFWSRIGVYVVSEVVPFTIGALIALTLWWRGGRTRWLGLGAFLLGLDLSTKLLGIWPLFAVLACLILLEGRRLLPRRLFPEPTEDDPSLLEGPPQPNHRTLRGALRSLAPLWAALGYALGAAPFLIYNLQTRGTWLEVRYSLFQSRSGVTNTTILPNLWEELDRFKVLLDGGYFWFQGWAGIPKSNPLPPLAFVVAAGGLLALAVRLQRRRVALTRTGTMLALVAPLPLLALAVVAILIPQTPDTLPLDPPLAATLAPALVVTLALSLAATVIAAGALLVMGLRRPLAWGRLAGWHLLGGTLIAGTIWWLTGSAQGVTLTGPLDLRAADVIGLAFWVLLAGLLLLLGWSPPAYRWQRPLVATIGFIAAIIGESFPTLSGLWATHLLVLLPMPQIVIAAGLAMLWRMMLMVAVERRNLIPALIGRVAGGQVARQMRMAIIPTLLLLAALMISDLRLDLEYHDDLGRTGGLFAFSDAIYDMADYVDTQPPTRPVAVAEWGIRRQIQILSRGRVNPDEIFQYDTQTPPAFYTALDQTLQRPNTLYLFTAGTIGPYHRFPDFARYLDQHGLAPVLEHQSVNRIGEPVYQAYSVRRK